MKKLNIGLAVLTAIGGIGLIWAMFEPNVPFSDGTAGKIVFGAAGIAAVWLAARELIKQ